jgi:hypothetical protein
MNIEGPALSPQLLEAVLDPAKDRSDVVDRLQTITNEARDGQPTGYIGQWVGFQEIVDESPILQGVVESTLDHLMVSPEEMKKELIDDFIRMGFDEDAIERARVMDTRFFFRNALLVHLEKWFRAGWEARGAVENDEQLKRMTE